MSSARSEIIFLIISEYQRSVITTLARIELALKDFDKRISILESQKTAHQEDVLLLEEPFSSVGALKAFDSTLVDKARRKQLVCINVFIYEKNMKLL